MRTTVAALALVCAAVLPPVAAQADTPVRRTVERSGPAAAHVRVEGSTGDVQVLGDDGTTVRVTARIRASSDAAADEGRRGRRAQRRRERRHGERPRKARRRFLHWIFDRRRISVDLVVRVPRRSGITAHQSTGDLDVRGIAGAIDARTPTGDVHLHDVIADASATTSTGDVIVDLAPGWNGRG